jgi:hypothetical protein
LGFYEQARPEVAYNQYRMVRESAQDCFCFFRRNPDFFQLWRDSANPSGNYLFEFINPFYFCTMLLGL